MKQILVCLIIIFLALNIGVNSSEKEHYYKKKSQNKLGDIVGTDSMKISVFSYVQPGYDFGGIHTLVCPIISKELEDELLCGLDKKYSASKFIFYSGFIKINNGIKVSISCVDILVRNMLKYIDTEYLFHGKCYTSFPRWTEEYLIHSVEMKESKDSFKYSLKSENKEYYSVKMPPLNDPSYITYQLPEGWFSTTAHTHSFASFFNKGKHDFCPKPNNMTSALMNVNIERMKKTYHTKLNNPDNLKIDSDFGKLFGLKNPINSKTVDLTKCLTSIWHNITKVNFMRAVSLEQNAPVPPTAKDKSLSKAKFLPEPYDKMSIENIEKFLHYNQTRNKRHDLNTDTVRVYNMIFH